MKPNPLLSLSPISPFDFLVPAIPHFETNGPIPPPLRASVSYWVGEENCQGGKSPTKWIPLQRPTLAEAVEVKKIYVFGDTIILYLKIPEGVVTDARQVGRSLVARIR